MKKKKPIELPKATQCFFCGGWMPPKDWRERGHLEYVSAWIDKYGGLEDMVGKIGLHKVCRFCAIGLADLAHWDRD